jgi:UDP-N-acetylmuramyl pentapeptide phosphotransferase/UDP-N-acetylglucosamine-1-phosphate transferase
VGISLLFFGLAVFPTKGMTVIALIKARWQRANQRGDISTALLALAPAAMLFLVFNLYPLL